jgi:hypothetical protein
MSDLEEILKRTLGELTEGYKTATADLHDLAKRSSEAVLSITGLPVRLELNRARNFNTGTTYDLNITQGDVVHAIAGFIVPPTGYPISVGAATDENGQVKPSKKLQDKDSLTQWFADMLGSPKSPLVLRLAFMLRQIRDQKDAMEHHESDDDDDDVLDDEDEDEVDDEEKR